jgi:uncharacterized protein (TIGR00106 family)
MLAEFSVAPMGGGTHLSEVVAEMLRIVDASGLPYEFHSMGTIVEGEWDEVMALIGRCHAAALRHGTRVSTAIKVDDAKGRTGRLKGKVDAVEKLVGRKLGRATE